MLTDLFCRLCFGVRPRTFLIASSFSFRGQLLITSGFVEMRLDAGTFINGTRNPSLITTNCSSASVASIPFMVAAILCRIDVLTTAINCSPERLSFYAISQRMQTPSCHKQRMQTPSCHKQRMQTPSCHKLKILAIAKIVHILVLYHPLDHLRTSRVGNT